MYVKVILGHEIKTEDGKILGKVVGGFDDKSVIIGDKYGMNRVATFGIVDENGQFQELCTGIGVCDNLCTTKAAFCRYNPKYLYTDIGYYVVM